MATRMQNLPRRRRKASWARSVWLRSSRQPSAPGDLAAAWTPAAWRRCSLVVLPACRGPVAARTGKPADASSTICAFVPGLSIVPAFSLFLPAQPAGLASFSWGRRSARALPRGRPWTCPGPSLSGKSKASACPCQAPVLALLALELGRGSRPWPSQASAAVPTGLSLSPGALSGRFRLPCRQRRPSHVQSLEGWQPKIRKLFYLHIGARLNECQQSEII